MKTTIKIAVIAMMGMSLGGNAQNKIESLGDVGIGTATPKGTLHISSSITSKNSTQNFDANLIIEGKSNTRTTNQGASIGFVVPANTDGTNPWQQGRILVSPDNGNTTNASGRMHLQTRYLDNEAWAWKWRDNIVLRSSGNVGIGTTSPSAKLDVNGDVLFNSFSRGNENGIFFRENFVNSNKYNLSILTYDHNGNASDGLSLNAYDGISFSTGSNSRNERMRISQNGNVGIGTTSPRAKQHLFTGNSNGIKDLYVTSIIEGMDARLQLMSSNAGSNGSSISLTNESSSWTLHQKTASLGNRFDIGYRISSESEDITARQNIYFSILKDGNIGIGTTNTKGFKLGVNGKVAATEVKVATYSNWSDFVFYEDYELPTLKEVENHIKAKGHLKDIPSAKEVEQNGFFLGEMDSKLLQKIEELTLYTIEQEKKIKKLEKQQKEIDELKALVQKLLKDKN
ncbi:hypothetical protein [Tenacibaculum sp. C7A-26P2]|uniref:hypothetical protein n=1 Tax=Tenacibaculum sp. C7A-26P2 TaxID=3447504 RepID=UPI003F87B59B